MLKDAPVIILDEATANVDPENEDWLQQAIEALTHEKTVLMIAHRLKTVRRADQILVLDGGQIVQQAALKTYRAARPRRRFCRRQEGDHGLEALNTFPPKPPRDKRFRSKIAAKQKLRGGFLPVCAGRLAPARRIRYNK